VHISALSDTFVKDPRDVVKAGDIVKVKVMAVDIERKRIGLSMRMSDDADEQSENTVRGKQPKRRQTQTGKRDSKYGKAHLSEKNTGSGSRDEKTRVSKSGINQESALALSLKAALGSRK